MRVELSSQHRRVLARVADPGSRYLAVDIDDPDRTLIDELVASGYVETALETGGRRLVQLTARGANALA